MGMVVQHNMNAINAYNKLNANVAGLKKSSEKLASGYRINRAGDDAAGLAISEKMRSQIRGLNQAVRNSQDGINMIQTYEGAAQESHNILQRMKELAEEAANGTYQNEVDREAAMLEFTQLNDELNQIADTDFNGVVMLNGGQMADGRLAVNGQFNYTSGPVAASKLCKNDVNILGSFLWDDRLAAAGKSLATSADGTTAAAGVTKADEAWANLNATWTRAPGKSGTSGPNSVDITFQYDAASNTWTAIEATNGANKNMVFTKATENGGFNIAIGGASGTAATEYADGDVVANVVLDTTKLTTGDTITITFNNPATGIDAPTNGTSSVVESASKITVGSDAKALSEDKANNLTVTVNATNVIDAKMTAQLNKLIEKLNSATVEITYHADADTDSGDMKISFGADEVYTYAGDDGKNTVTIDGVDYTFTFDDSNKLTISDAAGNELIVIEGQKQTGLDTDAKAGTAGVMTFNIAIEAAKYDDASKPTIEVKKTGSVSKANSNNTATAPLTYTDNLTLQTGARTKDSVNFSFEYSTQGMGKLAANLNISARADGLGTDGLSLLTQKDANTAIDHINNAINKVSMIRATFGATQNRLEHKITNLTTTSENLQEAESAIRDTDMASEMMNYTKFNILQQAAQSMLAQANAQPQSILQLLG